MRGNSIINTVNKFRMKDPIILSGTYLSVFLTVLLIVFRLPVINAQAQVYPVSVSTQLTPPYSVNLADYVAPGCEQLKVIIVQRDLTQSPYRLYLKMEIELNGRTIIRTSPYYIPPAFILEPGIPTLISGSSLAPFFDPANMEFPGYSRDQYMRTKILPEGAYVITFTAYDWTRRDVALSHGGAFFCYLAKAEPPMLNLPFNNALVTYSSPQYVNFQWLPGTTSSPNSAFSTKYRFELFEMRVGGISPSEIVTNTRPFFVTETDRTNLSYSIADPALEKGMRYVWRVKAYDIQGRDYIRNNGMSEVFSFVYGEGEAGVMDFSEIGNFTAAALTPRKAKLTWDVSEGYDSYRIYYRKQGKENKWYETETAQNSAGINGLSPGTIYECRVQGRKMNAWGSFSNTDTVLLPKIPVIECGSPFTPLDVSNREPLLELMKLQEFDAGGFMVTVIDPYALTTGPGRFTGRGFVQVPLFGHKKIRCEFKDIFINTDFLMVEGSIRLICDYADGRNAIWDIDEEFEGGGDNGTVINGTEEVAVMIPDVVIERQESVLLDTVRDDIVVIVESQDTLRINVAEKLKENPGSLTVQDSEGNLYSVDTKTGKATSLGKVPPPGSPQQLATPLPQVIDNRKGKVIFVPAPDQRFAFDQRSAQYARSNLFMEEYKTMQTEDGELYDIPYKLIPVGETDVVLARAELKGKTIKSDSIVFRSGTGTIYKAQPSGKTDEFLLTLPSGKDNDGIEIYATYTDSKKKTYVLGKLIVMSYSVKRPVLTLVPVNGNGTDTDPASVKAELDKIYQPVGVDWQVNLDNDFEAPVDSLDILGSGLFSMYTEGMKKLNNDFVMSKKESFNPSAVYLFLLRHSDDGVATGDMPRSKQFGYIFTETAKAGRDEAFYRTIAHEIAHGAFSLSHTFDEKYTIPEKTTTNLLDYTAGTDLVKHQWDAIHDPGLVIGMFERDEEGMIISNTYYWTPAGTPIHMPKNAVTILDLQKIKSKEHTNGILYTWREDKKVFSAKLENGLFKGYFVANADLTQTGVIIKSLTDEKYVDNTVLKEGAIISVSSIMYRGNCIKEDIITQYKLPESINGKLYYSEGKPLISSFQYTTGIKANRINWDCPDRIDLEPGPGYDFYTYFAPNENDEVKKQLILELARIINQQAESDNSLYNDFVQKKQSDWKDLTTFFCYTYEIKTNPEEQWQNTLSEFRKYISDFNNSLSKLQNTSSVELISETLKSFSDAQLKAMPMDLRIKLLKHLSNTFLNDNKEWLCIRLIENINDFDIKKLTDKLIEVEDSGQSLLGQLDQGFADYSDLISLIDKYHRLARIISEHLNIAYPFSSDQVMQLFGNRNFITWSDELASKNFTEINKGKININGIDYKPYEYVLLLSLNDYEYLNIPENKPCMVPAYIFHYLNKSRHVTKVRGEAINVTLNLVSVATGISALNAATKIGRILAIADVSISTVDIGVSIFNDKIRNIVGNDVVNAWSYLTIASGLANAGYDVYSSYSDEIIDNSKMIAANERKLVDAVTTTQNEAKASQVKEKINEIKKELKVDDIPNGKDELVILNKLIGKASSENTTWKNIDELNIIWANQKSGVLSTAKTFANETGTSLYDAVLSNGYYVKFDLNDGRILLGNIDGTYHAFAIVDDAKLSSFKSSIFNVNDEVFNTKLLQFLTANANKLEVLSGVVSKQLTIAGKTVTLSALKVNTILGRFDPDLKLMFSELGSFKNVGLGETNGGINLLNRPDYYPTSNWWNAYNKPWLEKAVNRGDDIYLATIPYKADEIIIDGKLLGSYAEELNYLVMRGYKPVNLTDEQWDIIKTWLSVIH